MVTYLADVSLHSGVFQILIIDGILPDFAPTESIYSISGLSSAISLRMFGTSFDVRGLDCKEQKLA